MTIEAFSSKRYLHIFIAGDSLVSFVSALKAKPNIEIFLLLKVPNNLFKTVLYILYCCQLFILITCSQYAATSGNPKCSER